jgi:hypothetical protein
MSENMEEVLRARNRTILWGCYGHPVMERPIQQSVEFLVRSKCHLRSHVCCKLFCGPTIGLYVHPSSRIGMGRKPTDSSVLEGCTMGGSMHG